MKSNIKDTITAVGFTVLLAAVLLLNIFLPDQERSSAERRILADLPELKVSSLLEGDYFEELEEYALDQFVMRDALRTVKSTVRLGVFMQLESNDLFLHDGGIYKLPPEVNVPAVRVNCLRLLEAAAKVWPDADMYYSIIPEKNTFVDSKAYPKFDADSYNAIIAESLPGVQNIKIDDLLSSKDYYLTDPHWRQECITDIADRLLSVMGNPVNAPDSFTANTAMQFRGTYHGQLPMYVEADDLIYLTGDRIDAATVFDYETNSTVGVYSHDKLSGMDPYDLYLGGARALLRIDNPSGTPGKELVIFRDSFGSSIAPLLLGDYERVTLVDLRYVMSDILPSLLTPSEQADVLFLFSQTILNNNGVFR